MQMDLLHAVEIIVECGAVQFRMLDDEERQQRGHDKTYDEGKHFIIF